MTREDSVMAVRAWWAERMSEGQLFLHPENFKKGRDFTGSLPWPDAARVVALKTEYEWFVGGRMGNFTEVFCRAAGLRGVQKKTRLCTLSPGWAHEIRDTWVVLPSLDSAPPPV